MGRRARASIQGIQESLSLDESRSRQSAYSAEVLMSQVSPGCREWLLKGVSQSSSASHRAAEPDCATRRLSVISRICTGHVLRRAHKVVKHCTCARNALLRFYLLRAQLSFSWFTGWARCNRVVLYSSPEFHQLNLPLTNITRAITKVPLRE